jgi:hypothetical protein
LQREEVIPRPMLALTDTLRLGGNEGAHARELVSPDDAKRLLTFLDNFLRYVYEIPAQLEDARPPP